MPDIVDHFTGRKSTYQVTLPSAKQRQFFFKKQEPEEQPTAPPQRKPDFIERISSRVQKVTTRPPRQYTSENPVYLVTQYKSGGYTYEEIPFDKIQSKQRELYNRIVMGAKKREKNPIISYFITQNPNTIRAIQQRQEVTERQMRVEARKGIARTKPTFTERHETLQRISEGSRTSQQQLIAELSSRRATPRQVKIELPFRLSSVPSYHDPSRRSEFYQESSPFGLAYKPISRQQTSIPYLPLPYKPFTPPKVRL